MLKQQEECSVFMFLGDAVMGLPDLFRQEGAGGAEFSLVSPRAGLTALAGNFNVEKLWLGCLCAELFHERTPGSI